MRTTRAIFAGVMIAVLGLASVARAAEEVVVEHRGSPVGTIARDTIGGAVLGSAVAGGIILYETQINDNNDYNWQRTLAWGALIGAGAGLVLGFVDYSTTSYAMQGLHARTPVRDGLSMTLDTRRHDQSNQELFGVYARRF